MQQEDEYRLHMELNRCLKKDTTITGVDPEMFESQTTRTVSSRGGKNDPLTCNQPSKSEVMASVFFCPLDDVFFSMADMDMSHSLSSLPPLGEPPTVDLDLSLNSNYSASPGESPPANATVSHYVVLYVIKTFHFLLFWCIYCYRNTCVSAAHFSDRGH